MSCSIMVHHVGASETANSVTVRKLRLLKCSRIAMSPDSIGR